MEQGSNGRISVSLKDFDKSENLEQSKKLKVFQGKVNLY